MGLTNEKLDYLIHSIDARTVSIDTKTAPAINWKDEVQELQAELAHPAKSQVEVDAIRSEEHAAFVQVRADLQQASTASASLCKS